MVAGPSGRPLPNMKPDNNHISIYDAHHLAQSYGDIVPPEGTDDTLKITGASTDVSVAADSIHGGAEDCVDINNRCERITVRAGEWHSGGKYIATIKGGSRDIELSGEIVRPGKSCDVELGNWSDQSQALTTGVRLNLTRRDGGYMHVMLWHADRPILAGGGPYKIRRAPWVVRTVFFTLKRIGLL